MISNGVSSQVVGVTPEMAAEWLKNNTKNRTLKKERVDRYSQEMAKGTWLTTGQGIQFSSSGELIDGQHRLHAVIKAGVMVEMLVVFGVDPKAFMVVDTGVARSGGDTLQIEGLKYPDVLSAALKHVEDWKSGDIGRGRVKFYSNQDLLWLSKKHWNLRSSVSLTARKPMFVPHSWLAAMHYLFAELDSDASDKFFLDLCVGANLSEADPVQRLRAYLLNVRVQSKNRNVVDKRHAFAIFVKAWNCRREVRLCHVLRFRYGGEHPEEMPVIS